MSARNFFLCAATLALWLPLPLRAGEAQIPVDDMDNWYCEYFAGGAGGMEGPRRGGGTSGPMAFDAYGNAYVAGGGTVFVYTSDDQVHHLAGLPGFAGSADGPAERACLAKVNAIACHPTDCVVYVSDIGNMVIKKLARGADGRWTATTVAGQPGKSGHKDGPGREGLLQRVDGIALDSKGNLYMADQDWLRRLSPDGQLVTLNPKGGTGSFGPGLEHDLESVKFNRIMGAGQLACDENDNVLIADRWNGTFLRVDVKAGKAVILAGGPSRGEPDWRKGGPRDGRGNTEAVFHTGGGPIGVGYDRLTKRVYTVTADEHAIRVIMPDGMVRTLGPWRQNEKAPRLAEGPVRDTVGHGYVALAGVDLQGRVYVDNRDGTLFRFYRKPAIEGAPEPKTPNPLLPWKAAAAAEARTSFSAAPEPPEAGKEGLAAGRAADCGVLSGAPEKFEAEISAGGRKTRFAHDPRRATLGASTLVVGRELVRKEGESPESRVKAEWSGEGGRTATLEVAAGGGGPVVVSDGSQFVVAYGKGGSVYARRISADGRMLDEDPIKLGGQWEKGQAIASNGEVAVVIAARQPSSWSPWGWSGPGAISLGRVTRDGKTPERFSVGPDGLADGGFAGLLDRSTWKGRKGWPKGAPGGFKNTESGYWPGHNSTVCWDGKTWLAAWERKKVQSVTDLDIFACRVDPATMMPTGGPVLVAGGAAEPGIQSHPVLVGLGDGTGVLFYLAVQDDGQLRMLARMLTGGALTGPARVEPGK